MSETRVLNIRHLDKFDRRFYQVTRIDRRSIFGNPFKIGIDGNRDEVCDKYKEWFDKRIASDPEFKGQVDALKGKNLGCWCKPERCHGDTIVAYLEGQAK